MKERPHVRRPESLHNPALGCVTALYADQSGYPGWFADVYQRAHAMSMFARIMPEIARQFA